MASDIFDLPHELVTSIFSLMTTTDLMAVALVCSQWASMVRSLHELRYQSFGGCEVPTPLIDSRSSWAKLVMRAEREMAGRENDICWAIRLFYNAFVERALKKEAAKRHQRVHKMKSWVRECVEVANREAFEMIVAHFERHSLGLFASLFHGMDESRSLCEAIITKKQRDVVVSLIEQGADFHEEDKCGGCALKYALMLGMDEVVLRMRSQPIFKFDLIVDYLHLVGKEYLMPRLCSIHCNSGVSFARHRPLFAASAEAAKNGQVWWQMQGGAALDVAVAMDCVWLLSVNDRWRRYIEFGTNPSLTNALRLGSFDLAKHLLELQRDTSILIEISGLRNMIANSTFHQLLIERLTTQQTHVFIRGTLHQVNQRDILFSALRSDMHRLRIHACSSSELCEFVPSLSRMLDLLVAHNLLPFSLPSAHIPMCVPSDTPSDIIACIAVMRSSPKTNDILDPSSRFTLSSLEKVLKRATKCDVMTVEQTLALILRVSVLLYGHESVNVAVDHCPIIHTLLQEANTNATFRSAASRIKLHPSFSRVYHENGVCQLWYRGKALSRRKGMLVHRICRYCGDSELCSDRRLDFGTWFAHPPR